MPWLGLLFAALYSAMFGWTCWKLGHATGYCEGYQKGLDDGREIWDPSVPKYELSKMMPGRTGFDPTRN